MEGVWVFIWLQWENNLSKIFEKTQKQKITTKKEKKNKTQIEEDTSTNNKKETQNLKGIDILIVSNVSLVSPLI